MHSNVIVQSRPTLLLPLQYGNLFFLIQFTLNNTDSSETTVPFDREEHIFTGLTKRTLYSVQVSSYTSELIVCLRFVYLHLIMQFINKISLFVFSNVTWSGNE